MRVAWLQDIGREFWAEKKKAKRVGASRTIMVDGFAVLKDNNYSLEDVRTSFPPLCMASTLARAARSVCCP